jgi:hypothetical protein
VSALHIPQHYDGTIDRVLIPHGLVLDRTEKMARDILAAASGRPIVLLCVLKVGSACIRATVPGAHQGAGGTHVLFGPAPVAAAAQQLGVVAAAVD